MIDVDMVITYSIIPNIEPIVPPYSVNGDAAGGRTRGPS
jgi:hypothetical protein